MFIELYDQNGQFIGEMMNTTKEKIKIYLDKGFKVINKSTKQEITLNDLYDMSGVSECVVDI